VKLETYAGLIRRYAPKINLVSLTDLDRLEERHIQDSLRLAPLVELAPVGPCADVGSGAGLPGIPLAVASPERSWRLIEPRAKRAGFLELVVRELELDNVEVVRATAQESAQRWPGGHALCTARALTSPAQALRWLTPLTTSGGTVAVFCGADAGVPEGAEEWEKGIAIVRVNRPLPKA
jgi:16S rRNA (guanine527-N7)-methyltransferase